MESICIRIEKPLAEKMEKYMKDLHYSTKTEFVREALRNRLAQIEEEKKEKAWQALFAARGSLKGKGKAKTDDEWHRLKEEAGREFIEEMKKKFNQK